MKSIERVRDMSCQKKRKKIVTIFRSFWKAHLWVIKPIRGWEWEFFWRTWKIAHFRVKVNPRGLTRNVIIFLFHSAVCGDGECSHFTFIIEISLNLPTRDAAIHMKIFPAVMSCARWWIDKVRGERSKISSEASVRQSEWVTKAELNEMIAHLFLYESRTHIFLHIFSDRIKLV